MSALAALLEAAAFTGLGVGAVFTAGLRRIGLIAAGLATAGLCTQAGDGPGVRLAAAVTLALALESSWRARAQLGRLARRLRRAVPAPGHAGQIHGRNP